MAKKPSRREKITRNLRLKEEGIAVNSRSKINSTCQVPLTAGQGVSHPVISQGVNPKDVLGMAKVSLSKLPPAASVYGSLAMMNGASKYGAYNFRQSKVIASIYVDACKRHLDSWFDGEECAADSGVPHIGHAIACLAILADCIENGNLVDDRPAPGNMSKLIEKWTKKS